ncbi:MAG: fumarylacetoacetate hydrolase family protein, partial [Pseudomonadota bacterium]
MRLATFHDGQEKLGILAEDEIIDLSVDEAIAAIDMIAALEAGQDFLDRAKIVAEDAPKIALSSVRLMAPVPRPRKILAVGLNYLDHVKEAEEAGIKIPSVPLVFNKQVTSVAGPFDDVHLPKVSSQLDYEAEFAIVIGKRCRHVKKENAADVVAGFVTLNDVSVRDWQLAAQTFTVGKSFDTHCPFGPAIVTIDETG